MVKAANSSASKSSQIYFIDLTKDLALRGRAPRGPGAS
jgi:hypothetical protein